MVPFLLGVILIYAALFLAGYSFYKQEKAEEPSLPKEMLQGDTKKFALRQSITRLFSPMNGLIRGIPILKGIQKRLDTAGNVVNLAEFVFLKAIATLGAGVFGPLLLSTFFKEKELVFMISLAVGFILPDLWLNKVIAKRRKEISRDLPLAIDLLKLCVGAGLDFMVAVQRVVKEARPSALTRELQLLWQEVHMGKSRREALKNLSGRLNMPEISSFSRTLIQADRMGSPISDALQIQSEEIRMRRFQRGEEQALKAPIKLLIPLILFILPVVLVIVGGPILLQFMRGDMLKF